MLNTIEIVNNLHFNYNIVWKRNWQLAIASWDIDNIPWWNDNSQVQRRETSSISQINAVVQHYRDKQCSLNSKLLEQSPSKSLS
jgi:hypothetical protein